MRLTRSWHQDSVRWIRWKYCACHLGQVSKCWQTPCASMSTKCNKWDIRLWYCPKTWRFHLVQWPWCDNSSETICRQFHITTHCLVAACRCSALLFSCLQRSFLDSAKKKSELISIMTHDASGSWSIESWRVTALNFFLPFHFLSSSLFFSKQHSCGQIYRVGKWDCDFLRLWSDRPFAASTTRSVRLSGHVCA